MRLRNIPRADDTLQAHFTVIKNPKEFRGNWTSVFGNDRPIRIEIGMGKGRFLLNMAKTYPNINFIGIERYSSVLLRAVEKFDTEEFSDLPICLHGCKRTAGSICRIRSRPHLPEFFRPMAKITSCKTPSYINRVSIPL